MTRRRRKQSEPVAATIDGEPATCVTVGNSIPFARACLRAWGEREERAGGKARDRRQWMLRKGFWVPNSVLDRAREIVEAEASGEAERVGL